MLGDLGGASSIAMARMGDALGLYRALHAKGAMTCFELAKEAGVNQRYLREWLSHQAASNYLSYEPRRPFLLFLINGFPPHIFWQGEAFPRLHGSLPLTARFGCHWLRLPGGHQCRISLDVPGVTLSETQPDPVVLQAKHEPPRTPVSRA